MKLIQFCIKWCLYLCSSFCFVMNGLRYVRDGFSVSLIFLERVIKVTGLGVVVSRWSGNDISRVPGFCSS